MCNHVLCTKEFFKLTLSFFILLQSFTTRRRKRVLSVEVRGALAARWRDNGLAEHASVASFSRHSLQLMALAAPADLVEATHRAAIDEISHAKVRRSAFTFISLMSRPLKSFLFYTNILRVCIVLRRC